MSLAIKEELDSYTDDISFKWPNDIYWKNKKICGMLIENDLMGRTIRQSISGIGINVNQEAFHSSAPNPVSLQQITGKQYEIFGILRNIMLRVQSYYELLRNDDTEFIANRYEKALFRKEGMHRYKTLMENSCENCLCRARRKTHTGRRNAEKKRLYV